MPGKPRKHGEALQDRTSAAEKTPGAPCLCGEMTANLSAFFKLSGDMLWVLDMDGTILETNAHGRLGFGEGELLGRNVLDVHPRESRTQALATIRDMVEGKTDVCRLSLVRRDGSRIPVDTKVSPGVWNGRPVLFGSSRDVTQIILSEEKFSRAFNASPALMAISSAPEGRFMDVNQTFLATLGYSREEVIGKTSRELGLYDEYATRDTAVRSAIGSDGSTTVEQKTRTRNGRFLDGLYTTRMIRIGDESAIFTVMQDMTEHNRTRRLLERQIAFEELLFQLSSLLFNAAPEDLGRTVDEVLRGLGQFSESDRSYLFRLSENLEVMTNTNEWCAPDIEPQISMLQDLPSAIFPTTMKTLGEGEDIHVEDVSALAPPWTAEKEILEAQGIKSVLLIPVMAGSRLYGYMGFDSVRMHRTWSRESRRMLRYLANSLAAVWMRSDHLRDILHAQACSDTAAREAERTAKIRRDFIATMSHEIRTPLNGIAGMVEFLSSTRLDGTQKRYVDTIRNSCAALGNVTSQILDYSRLEAEGRRLELADFDIRETITKALFPYAEIARSKDVAFTADFSPSIPDQVRGDSAALSQIVVNLTDNALKYTRRGSVAIRVFAERAETSKVVVGFEVEDTGIGIPADRIDSLYEPYMRVHSPLSRKVEGTGLGLPIVKQLVDLMGGSIDIVSEIDHGTKCRILLPLVPKAGTTDLQPAAFHPDRICGILLDLEDAETNRLRDLFVSWGMRVRTASSPDGSPVQAEPDGITRILITRAAPPQDASTGSLPEHRQNHCPPLRISRFDSGEIRFPVDERSGIELPGDWTPSALFGGLRTLVPNLHTPIAVESRHRVRYLGVHALIVDDDETSLEVLEEMLNRLGIIAECVSSGEAAVEAFDKKDFDLVFMDIELGGMDGFRTTSALRALMDRRGRAIPVIAVSAHLIGDTVKTSAYQAPDDAMPKPYSPDALAVTLETWLPKKTAPSGDAVRRGTASGASSPEDPQVHQDAHPLPLRLLQELDQALREHDPSRAEGICEEMLASDVQEETRPALENLKRTLTFFDFGESLAILRALPGYADAVQEGHA